ncbi:unnamed protein product [Ilex paraguariensis]|uniref:Uncharacterized protein n=1 Tax=Ilex paraguariensis TaxID=185542 RepID=A0ABC8UGT2_9AQUA
MGDLRQAFTEADLDLTTMCLYCCACLVDFMSVSTEPPNDMMMNHALTVLLSAINTAFHTNRYLYLSKLVTMPGASGAFLRLVLDQFLFAPIFIGVFLSTLVTLEGRPLEVMPKLRQEWFSSVLANWQLWIPFQFLNFRFVPQQFQQTLLYVEKSWRWRNTATQSAVCSDRERSTQRETDNICVSLRSQTPLILQADGPLQWPDLLLPWTDLVNSGQI